MRPSVPSRLSFTAKLAARRMMIAARCSRCCRWLSVASRSAIADCTRHRARRHHGRGAYASRNATRPHPAALVHIPRTVASHRGRRPRGGVLGATPRCAIRGRRSAAAVARASVAAACRRGGAAAPALALLRRPPPDDAAALRISGVAPVVVAPPPCELASEASRARPAARIQREFSAVRRVLGSAAAMQRILGATATSSRRSSTLRRAAVPPKSSATRNLAMTARPRWSTRWSTTASAAPRAAPRAAARRLRAGDGVGAAQRDARRAAVVGTAKGVYELPPTSGRARWRRRRRSRRRRAQLVRTAYARDLRELEYEEVRDEHHAPTAPVAPASHPRSLRKPCAPPPPTMSRLARR